VKISTNMQGLEDKIYAVINAAVNDTTIVSAEELYDLANQICYYRVPELIEQNLSVDMVKAIDLIEASASETAAEIDNEVVANAREPGVELPVLAIAALAYGHNGAHKGLLEKVVGYVGVVDSTKNVAIKAVLIARQQDIESFVVTGTVKLYQLLVGKLL